jgi:glycerophosphoryl diester phosphodiesterase
MTLPSAFLGRPIAHRGLHGPGVPENSLASFEAAIAAGYGIELDLQISADGVAMVFHDYGLERLTPAHGLVRDRDSAALAAIPLTGGAEGIPSLAQVLRTVDGRAPLLIEIKDQDGTLGPNVGALEEATAEALSGYDGPIAVMSFNPHSVARLAALAPEVPRGLTTCAFGPSDWPNVPEPRRDDLATIPDYASVGACFISHEQRDLDNPRVTDLRSQGAAILTWTIRSPEEEALARRIADNITFEGYAAP